jgi:hypothetical protein
MPRDQWMLRRRINQRGVRLEYVTSGLRAVCMMLALVVLGPGPAVAASLTEVQRFEWRDAAAGFGGISDVMVDSDGAGMLAVSDHGTVFAARIGRDAGGRIVSVNAGAGARFHDNKGVLVSAFKQDAEDLAPGRDGEFYVSFEGYARISAFRLPDLMPRTLHNWDRFRPYWGNTAFEGLATLPDGRLIAVLEAADEGEYVTFLGGPDGWTPGPRIPAPGGYAATGADIGPDGALYLIERDVSMLGAFSTRVRRFRISGVTLDQGETVLKTDAGDLPNMEGISLWRASDGSLMATAVSDNGFDASDPTLLVEFRVTE